MKKLRILISGGGLAGLALAYWLHHHGHEAVVIERAPDLRRDGYGLDFFGTGYDVAERMGIIEDLARTQIFINKESGIAFVNADGKPVAELKIDAVRQVLGGKYMGLMHYNLEEVLYDTVKHNVEIRFGTSITAVSQTPDSVTVSYETGGSESFDLLVGADGIHSNVRNLVFGPEKEFAYYLGYYLACYFIPDKYQLQATWANYTEPARQIGAYDTDREGQLATLFLWQAEDEGYIAHDRRAEKIKEAFAGMGWLTPQILDDMPRDGKDILVDTVTQIRMDTWRSGRVVLLGDAAGCMTLISGQGASMALGGAYVLAEELGRTEDWQQALANFEHRVKPQMDLRQRKAHDFAKQFVPGSELGVKAELVMMKLVTYHAFSGLLKSQFVGDSFLETAALRRLPESHNNILGYRIEGTLQGTDYETLAMGMDESLQSAETVNLLLELDELEGVKREAILADWKFGRKYHKKIGKLAVVGSKKWEKWTTKLASPFYAQETEFFYSDKLQDAWQWMNDAA